MNSIANPLQFALNIVDYMIGFALNMVEDKVISKGFDKHPGKLLYSDDSIPLLFKVVISCTSNLLPTLQSF